MADKEIDDLTAAGTLDGTELAHVVQSGNSRKATTLVIAGLSMGPTITTSGTSYNLLNADKGKYNRFTSTSAKTLTVQPDATEALDQDGEWNIRNVGANNITITEGSGVTVNVPTGGTLVVPPGGTVTLKRVAADELDLIGTTVAA